MATKKLAHIITTALGSLALASAMTAAVVKYKPYFGDPDIFRKIAYDISSVNKPEIPSHKNSLYALLISGSVYDFGTELEKEAQWFSNQFRYPYKLPIKATRSKESIELWSEDKQIPIENLVNQNYIQEGVQQEFDNDAAFIAYLESKKSFLEQSLNNGYFLDASILAKQLNLDKTKVKLLFDKANLQIWHMRRPKVYVKFDDKEDTQPDSELEREAEKEWISRLYNHIERIKGEWKSTDYLNRLGETKKRIFDKARERYQETKQRVPIEESYDRVFGLASR